MLSKYQKPRDTRREARTLAGRFRGGKLAPVMATPFLGSESGSVSQSITYELDPIAGRMITDITAEVVAVYVPMQAIDALKNPEDDYPGASEVFRQKLLSGSPVFGLEDETEISKRLGLVPRSIAGEKKVNECARIAHNVAINFLRKRKYVKAAQLLHDNTAITPAIISQTVLDRLNGVLDPEDRVNGAVPLSGIVPVQGLGRGGSNFANANQSVKESGAKDDTYAQAGSTAGSGAFYFEEDPDNPQYPHLRVDLSQSGGQLSIQELYEAEKMDMLVREMRKMVDERPQYGEEIVSRFAHGLSVDVGKEPFVIYEQQRTFSNGIQRAMDGPSLGFQSSNLVTRHEFVVPVPATEFGGIVVTFAAIKPDETLASQPHPILSEPWGAINFVADEMALDPVPVPIRDIDGDCAQVDEETVVCYIGNNHLKKTYVNYGFNRHLDKSTVAAKTALWQIEVPMSVTQDSILYPNNLNHYPFADQLAEVCTYTIENIATINTPLIFGPTPVEELAEIETADIFEDA